MKYLVKLGWLLVLIIAVLVLVSRLLNLNYGLITFGLWLISIAALVKLAKPNHRTIEIKRPKTHRSRFDFNLVVVLVVTLIPLLLALKQPNKLFFHGDEAIISRQAEMAVDRSITTGNWNLLGHEDGTITRFPAAWYVAQGLVIKALGPSTTSVRVLSAIFQLIIVVIQYKLIKKYFSSEVAMGWTIIYATAPIVIHFSLSAYQNLGSSVFAVLAIAYAIEAMTNTKLMLQRYWLVETGVLAGFGLYTYFSSLLIPLYIVAIILIFASARKKRILQTVLYILSFVTGFIVTAIPYIVVSLNDYNLFLGRKSTLTPLISSLKHHQILDFLSQQTIATMKPLVSGGFTGDGYFYVHQPVFIHILLGGFVIVSLIGAMLGHNQLQRQQKLIVVSTFSIILITLILGTILTANPPAAQRVLVIFPYLYFLVAMGLWISLRRMQNWLNYIFRLVTTPIRVTHPQLTVLFFIFVGTIATKQLQTFFSVNIRLNEEEHMTNQVIQDFVVYYLNLSATYHTENSTLLAAIPTQNYDQIYYYSGGKIDAIKARGDWSQLDEQLSRANKIYFLTDTEAPETTPERNFIKVWQEDHLYLYLVD